MASVDDSGSPAVLAREEAPGGVTALVCGILGLTLVPVVLSLAAIIVGRRARRLALAEPDRLKFDLARIGLILGWIGLGFGLLGTILAVALAWPTLG